jgi:hypothetical protein
MERWIITKQSLNKCGEEKMRRKMEENKRPTILKMIRKMERGNSKMEKLSRRRG